MAITFDQLIDCMLGSAEPESGFEVQSNIHLVLSVLYEWKMDNITSSQAQEILNVTNSDEEAAAVRTFLGGIDKADMLAIERALMLARRGISATGVTYDKTLIRNRFGLDLQ